MMKHVLVTQVAAPVIAHAPGTYQVTVTYMTQAYVFQDEETGKQVEVKSKRRKSTVFTNYRPKIGQIIKVNPKELCPKERFVGVA